MFKKESSKEAPAAASAPPLVEEEEMTTAVVTTTAFPAPAGADGVSSAAMAGRLPATMAGGCLSHTMQPQLVAGVEGGVTASYAFPISSANGGVPTTPAPVRAVAEAHPATSRDKAPSSRTPTTGAVLYDCKCMFLKDSDKIILVDFPSMLVALVKRAIEDGWRQGIQRERTWNESFATAHEFKLFGYPWHGSGEDAIHSRLLLLSILKKMAQSGWKLLAPVDASKSQGSKDALFFEYIGVSVPGVDMFAISMNRSDRLRVIGAPSCSPVSNTIRDAIKKHYPPGIQRSGQYYNVPEFKLAGYPWRGTFADVLYGRRALAGIMQELSHIGYKLYTSADISTGTEGEDVDSLFFRRIDEGFTW